ncbi:MAG: glycosyltransferase [Betaproteobacteria bacterium AqS2]|uniref:Glycosyltransferase n=1 Tax=Candidatus Amphirhobacter heronislandensis TaxID=1732024 RepID=A0A930UCE6_9GAMM|nr:glycosyltransferase [Betaproteobacteria bacterium AqS2]
MTAQDSDAAAAAGGEPVVSVLLPLYNEERRLPRTYPQFLAFLDGFAPAGGAELVLADDCSADGTWKLIEGLAREREDVVAVRVPVHGGKGAALRLAAARARGRSLLAVDCDLSTDFSFYPPFAKLLQEHDIVIGSRRVAGADVTKSQNLYKRCVGQIAQFLINRLNRWDYGDVNCGFKLYGPRTLGLFRHTVLDSVLMESEMLNFARLAGLRVKEEPVVWTNDEETRIGMRQYLHAMLELCWMRLRFILGRYDVAAIKAAVADADADAPAAKTPEA